MLLALALLFSAARAEKWKPAEDNLPKFRELFDLLGASCADPENADTAGADALVEEIRKKDPGDGDIGRAIVDHWRATVLDPGYDLFIYRWTRKAGDLKGSRPDFGSFHAFVVLGYCLEGGEMAPELTGRCEAAAAAARAFPDSVLICTGGVTGSDNPEGHSEAGEMKKYLTETCGIAGERIFTDEEAMTTGENAVNSLRIMRRLGVDTYTIVTSDYHQLWGQVLFSGVAAVYAQRTGYTARLVANYNYHARGEDSAASYARSGLSQLASLFSRGIETDP